MKKLFTCYYGSRLYGTQTPTSDLDIKHVVLLDIDDLLLGKKLVNKVTKTNNVKDTRNTADDVDEEFIPLQLFAQDFFAGQTYALELAFSLEGTHAGQTFYDDNGDSIKPSALHMYHTPIYQFIVELRKSFLTSNIKAMMGYVINQASLYSFKGERLNAVRAVKEAYLAASEIFPALRVGDLLVANEVFDNMMLELELKHPKYVKRTTYDIGTGTMKPCFTLLEKTLPFTDKITHGLDVIKNLEAKYGTRADAATADNVDWKAMMHALRIVDEGLELLQNKQLTFPFTVGYVKFLLDIKNGRCDIDRIKQELDLKMYHLKELEQTTSLPAVTPELREKFEQWLISRLRSFYKVD